MRETTRSTFGGLDTSAPRHAVSRRSFLAVNGRHGRGFSTGLPREHARVGCRTERPTRRARYGPGFVCERRWSKAALRWWAAPSHACGAAPSSPRRLRRAVGPPASARARSPPDTTGNWCAHCHARTSSSCCHGTAGIRAGCRMPVPLVVVRSLIRVCIMCITALHWSSHSRPSTPRYMRTASAASLPHCLGCMPHSANGWIPFFEIDTCVGGQCRSNVTTSQRSRTFRACPPLPTTPIVKAVVGLCGCGARSKKERAKVCLSDRFEPGGRALRLPWSPVTRRPDIFACFHTLPLTFFINYTSHKKMS